MTACEHNAMLEVTPVPAFRDNYIWLVTGTQSRRTAIVDPGDAGPVLDALDANGLEPCAILITHHHGDHVGGVTQLLSHFDVPVYGPATESIPGRTTALAEGDQVRLEALPAEFRILDIPGHTAGHIAYFGHGMLFAGDTLFMSGCGRLFEGTAEQMYASLEKIRRLPGSTRVYCAHEYTLANLRFARAVEPNNDDLSQRLRECTALRERGIPTVPGPLDIECATNPFLRAHVPVVREAAARHAGQALGADSEVFAALRRWKDDF